MKKSIAVAVSLVAILGVLGAVDAFAAAYPPALGGTGTQTAPLPGQVLIGSGANAYTPAYILCAGTCQVATSSGGITITGTGIANNAGNWAGTWQLLNPSDFLSSSTQKVISVNGLSGVVTITSSSLGVVWPTVNGNQATNYNIVPGTSATSTVIGATTTISVALDNGMTQTCSANQFVTQITASGITSCGAVTFPTPATYTYSVGAGISISQATSSSNTTTTFTNTGVTSLNGATGTVTISSSSLGVTNASINGALGNLFNFVASSTGSVLSITTSTSGGSSTVNFLLQLSSYLKAALQSLNGATSSAQTIAGGTGINVSTLAGSSNSTTTVTNTGVTSFTGQGCVTAANSTGTVALTVTCISGNQTITFTINGDATGTASGATSITDTITVTGLNGKALPANTTGTLQFSAGAWKINLATSSLGAYDANGNLSSYLGSSCGGGQYVTGFSASGTVTCGTPSGSGSLASTTPFTSGNLTEVSSTGAIATFGGSLCLSGSLATGISASGTLTCIPTSTVLSGYITTSTFNAIGTAWYLTGWNNSGTALLATTTLYEQSSTGYIGINTTNPQGQLDIENPTGRAYFQVGTTQAAGTSQSEASMIWSTPSGIAIQGLANSTGRGINDTAAGDYYFGLRTGGRIMFSTDNSYTRNDLTISSSGLISIATTTTNGALFINGTTTSPCFSNNGITCILGGSASSSVINGATSTNQTIVGGTGESVATVAGAANSTTTVTLNINNGSIQTCTSGQLANSLSGTAIITCQIAVQTFGGVNTSTISLLGTQHEVIVATTTNSITLSTPQPIDTTSAPTFGGLLVNGNVTTTNAVVSSTLYLETVTASGTLYYPMYVDGNAFLHIGPVVGNTPGSGASSTQEYNIVEQDCPSNASTSNQSECDWSMRTTYPDGNATYSDIDQESYPGFSGTGWFEVATGASSTSDAFLYPWDVEMSNYPGAAGVIAHHLILSATPVNATGTWQGVTWSMTGNTTINGTLTQTNATSALALLGPTGTITAFAGSSCSGGQYASSISATGTIICGTPAGGGGGGSGNVSMNATSTSVSGNVPYVTTSGSSTISTTSTLSLSALGATLTGLLNVTNGINATGTVTVSSNGNGSLNVFRAANTNYGDICIGTGATTNWCFQMNNDGSNNGYLLDPQNGGNILKFVPNGVTTIGNSGSGVGITAATAFTASTTLTVNQTTTLSTSLNGLLNASSGVVSAYGGSSCGGGQYASSISATGTVICGTPAGGAGVNINGTGASSTVQINIQATTSTSPTITTSSNNPQLTVNVPDTQHGNSWIVGPSGTTGVDFTSIQNAMTACGAVGGGQITLMGGTYAQAGTGLLWKGSNCSIWGDYGSSTITFTGATTGFATGSSTAEYSHDEIHNLTITMDGNAAGVAIDASNMSHNTYQNITMSDVGYCYRFHDTVDITFYNTVQGGDCTSIVKAGVDGSSTEPWNANIIEDSFFGCGTANCVGMLSGNSEHNTMLNDYWEPNGSPLTGSIGVSIFDASTGSNPGNFGNLWINNYLEGNATAVKVAAGTSCGSGECVLGDMFIGGISDTNGTLTLPTSTGVTFLNFNNNFQPETTLSSHVGITGETNAPTVGSCGTSPTLETHSNDNVGTITVGTAKPSACTLTFAISWPVAPVCIAQVASGTPIAITSKAGTASDVMTFATSTPTSTQIAYHCFGDNSQN